MTEEYWVAVLKEEDRLLSNSDRKYRYHCNSLESMSEELTFQESCFYIQEDFTVQCEIRDFIDTIQNERLAEGLRHLTDRQRQVIELYFWKGYQCKEIQHRSFPHRIIPQRNPHCHMIGKLCHEE